MNKNNKLLKTKEGYNYYCNKEQRIGAIITIGKIKIKITKEVKLKLNPNNKKIQLVYECISF